MEFGPKYHLFIRGENRSCVSSTKTLQDAIREANHFEELAQADNEVSYDIEDETDSSIVHRAIGILRKHISSSVKKLENQYYSPDEMTLNAQKDFLDPLLLQAVYWLTNENAFQEAGDTEHILNAKCLAISSGITTLVKSVPSPKHLGLAVHLYNEIGSRHLIEDMLHLLSRAT